LFVWPLLLYLAALRLWRGIFRYHCPALILLPGVYLLGIESVMVQHFSGTGLPLAIPLFWIVTVVCNVALNLFSSGIWRARPQSRQRSFRFDFYSWLLHFR
jgi:hypothetical protein